MTTSDLSAVVGRQTLKRVFHKDLLSRLELEELADYCDDTEMLNGVCLYGGGPVHKIDIDKLLDDLGRYFDNADKIDKRSYRHDVFVDIESKLSKWRGYTLWM